MNTITRLLAWLEGREVELEVDEEFRFHLDLLRERYETQGLAAKAALDASLKQFGDVDRVRHQCVAISRRSRPIMRALKVVFVLMFFAGVLVRIFSPELQITRMGDVLMMVAASGRLFLYVRGLSPSNFFPGNKTRWPLRLIDGSKTPVPAFDEHKRTPTERVISGE